MFNVGLACLACYMICFACSHCYCGFPLEAFQRGPSLYAPSCMLVLEVRTLETFRCYYYLVNKINKHTYLTHILYDSVRGSHFRNIPLVLLFGKQNKQTRILNTHTV